MANKVLNEEIVKKSCSLAMKAQNKPDKFLIEKSKDSSNVVIVAFPGSWSVNDWFSKDPFGEIKVDPQMFRSIRSVGIGVDDAPAQVNKAFLDKFISILQSLEREVSYTSSS